MKSYKTYGFWTALAGAVVVLLNALGDCFGFSINNEIVSNVIMAIAGLLVVLGVVSMPKEEISKGENEESAEEVLEESDDEEEPKE